MPRVSASRCGRPTRRVRVIRAHRATTASTRTVECCRPLDNPTTREAKTDAGEFAHQMEWLVMDGLPFMAVPWARRGNYAFLLTGTVRNPRGPQLGSSTAIPRRFHSSE